MNLDPRLEAEWQRQQDAQDPAYAAIARAAAFEPASSLPPDFANRVALAARREARSLRDRDAWFERLLPAVALSLLVLAAVVACLIAPELLQTSTDRLQGWPLLTLLALVLAGLQPQAFRLGRGC